MRTALTTTLKILVVKELNPSSGIMAKDKIEAWFERMPEIKEGLFEIMKILIYGCASSGMVCRYIGQIQKENIFLMDTLLQYTGIPEQMKTLHQFIFDTLEEILEHIKTHYKEYFNFDQLIPKVHFNQATREIEEKMNFLIAGLKRKSADMALQRLIQESLTDFLKAGCCTYYRMAYMKGLQSSLSSLCDASTRAEVDDCLKEQLFYLNLNTAGHLNYYRKAIAERMAQTFDVGEQMELLYNYEKQFRTWRQQKLCFFSARNRGIKGTLLEYIRAEIKCMTKTQQAPVQAISIPPGPQQPVAVNSYRIPVSFSVDALAYFFKLLIKAGVINGGPKTQLLFFISKSFQTPGIGNGTISATSINNKYKQVVQTTAKAVRVVLVRMLKLLDEEFN